MQNELFNLGNMVATLHEDFNSKMPSINEDSLKEMEQNIDLLNASLPLSLIHI